MFRRLATATRVAGLSYRLLSSVAMGIVVAVETRKYLKRELKKPDPLLKNNR